MEIVKKILQSILAQNKSRKQFVIGIIVLFLGTEVLAWQLSSYTSMSEHVWSQKKYQSAVDASRAFYDTREVTGIDSLLLQEILWPEMIAHSENVIDPFERVFDRDRMANDLEMTRAVQSHDELAVFLAREPLLDNQFYTVNEKYVESLTDPWDDIMLKALYCDRLGDNGYDDVDYAILTHLGDGRGGYLDTHRLLGLLFLEKNECFDQENISHDKEQVIATIIDAQKTDDVFSDLYAERIVFLYWAGRGDAIKREWVDTIVDNQQEDGGWRDGGEAESHPHTTGLAAIAVKYFTEGKAQQRFY